MIYKEKNIDELLEDFKSQPQEIPYRVYKFIWKYGSSQGSKVQYKIFNYPTEEYEYIEKMSKDYKLIHTSNENI